MAIDKINNPVNQVNPNSKLHQVQNQVNTNQTTSNTNTKKDTLFLSEKAKDLAAKQNGTAYQEELKETQASKDKELNQD